MGNEKRPSALRFFHSSKKQAKKIQRLSMNANGKNLLHEACSMNNVPLAYDALKSVDVNSTDKKGRTALHFASRMIESKQLLSILLDEGADAHAQDQDGLTALHFASDVGNWETAEYLIWSVSKSLLDVVDNEGGTALHWACFHGYLEVVEILVDAGRKQGARHESVCGKVDGQWSGMVPLEVAKKRGNAHLFKLFRSPEQQLPSKTGTFLFSWPTFWACALCALCLSAALVYLTLYMERITKLAGHLENAKLVFQTILATLQLKSAEFQDYLNSVVSGFDVKTGGAVDYALTVVEALNARIVNYQEKLNLAYDFFFPVASWGKYFVCIQMALLFLRFVHRLFIGTWKSSKIGGPNGKETEDSSAKCQFSDTRKKKCEKGKFGQRNCWCEPPSTNLMLRDVSYMEDKSKLPAKRAIFAPFQVVMLEPGVPSHLVKNSDAVSSQLNLDPEAEWLFIVFNIPAHNRSNSVVYSFKRAVPEHQDLAFDKLWTKFRDTRQDEGGVDEFRNHRFKYAPRLTEGPWALKSFYTRIGAMRAVLLGKRIKINYFIGSNYTEVDVDVGSDLYAQTITGMVYPDTTTKVSVDHFFIIQGEEKNELPERLLASVRIST